MRSFALIFAGLIALFSHGAGSGAAAADPSGAEVPPVLPARNGAADHRGNVEVQGQPHPASRTADAGDVQKADQQHRPGGARRATQKARSLTARKWNEFRATIAKCVGVPLSQREPCLADARTTFRAARIDCPLLPGAQRKWCVKYAKLWEDQDADLPAADVTDDEDGSPGQPIRDEHAAEHGPEDRGGGQ